MKKLLLTLFFIVLIIYSFLRPEIIIEAAKNGLQIWFNQILPTLLPFTILSNLLVKSNFLKTFHGNENLVSIIITMICGFVFGFPIGAKLSADFYKQNLLTEKQATYLAIVTNNFSPMYVCGFALPYLFSSVAYNQRTYIFLYLLPLIIGFIFLLLDKTNLTSKKHKKTTSRFHLNMQIMDASIINGFESLIKICGYIMIFSILSQILVNVWKNPSVAWILFLGNLEISNGIHLLSEWNISENIKYISAIQLLSFGGISGIAQTCSILADSGLSTHKYIIGKVALSLFLTLLCVIYVLLII